MNFDVTTGDIEIQRQDHYHLIYRRGKIRMAEGGGRQCTRRRVTNEAKLRAAASRTCAPLPAQLWRGATPSRQTRTNHLPSARPSASCDGTRCSRGTSCEVVCQRTGSIPSALRSANKRNKGLCHSIILGRAKYIKCIIFTDDPFSIDAKVCSLKDFFFCREGMFV